MAEKVTMGANFGQAQPPWQLWGNTQVITVAGSPFTAPNITDKNQTLVRISYGRPETWRFLFAAKLIAAPSAAPANQANVSVWFELIVGIGRAAVKIPFFKTLPGWNWSFAPATNALNQLQWSAHSDSSANSFISLQNLSTSEETSGTATIPVDQIVGQDITVNAVVSFTTDLPGATQAQVEVSSMWSPNNHVRPDWMLIDADRNEQFPGGETGGR